MNYRAEIDGLRAIAVVSVILYHAQMVLFNRDWFEGGFIGVDIFFVISGYLITRIILSELESKGSFNFINFYERRARRILPMLCVVIFVSVPYAWQMLLPSEFIEYAESILASLFFGSNFFFYFSTTEYGADSALLKPFLHTWSLGVEEPFYLVFPILAIVAFKYFRKHFLTILVGLSLLSLQFAELMEVRNSDFNFYLPFSRFWELAVGSMLAYRELYYKPSKNKILYATNHRPIIGSDFDANPCFDGETPHPSFHTLIPIIGVALIIGFASKDELVGKILASKPFVWIGLISYSAYLWHFPIFAFSRLGKELTNYDKVNLIALTLILSVLSYFFIEMTFRRKHTSKFFFGALSLSLLIIFFGVFCSKHSDGFKFRYANLMHISLDKRDYADAHTKYKKEIQKDSVFDVQKINILFIGNSHAADLKSAFYQNKNLLHEFNLRNARFVHQISCFDPNALSDKVKTKTNNFFSSRDYELSNIIIVSTRFREEQPCSRNLPTLNDFYGLRILVDRALRDGKRVIIFGTNVEFKLYERRKVHLLDHKLFELVDKVGGIEKIRSKDFKHITDNIGKQMYGDIEERVRPINLNLRNIADELNVPFIDKYALSCSDLKKSCEVLTRVVERSFGTLPTSLERELAT